ncbi:hypothetical protein V865_001552 [Kwoniella europaea PYCC6329]|uniref:Uncharacterized protein n=1 Tax=Kwoniella europaea PYCC6329 TaxID=1423913 RepID=A0AAX4KAU8_9TREE
MSLRLRSQPLSKWSTASLSLLLISLSQSILVNSQYISPQALAYRRSYVNSTLVGRGDESNDKTKDNSDAQSQSQSKELWLMSHEDFCVYGLSEENKGKMLSESVDNVISYCSKSGHGTRLIPDGTLKGVTYVRTPSWVQVSGSGDFSQIGISSDDSGAQFDSSSHNPQGSGLITSQGGDPAKDWVTMISGETFCVRACFGDPAFCPTQYDSLGCYFLTSNGVGWDDVWQDCEGDEGDPPGVIDGQTYTPGNGPVPTQSIPTVSNCQPGSSIQNGQTAAAILSSQNATASGTEGGEEASTSWVPVQTCLPCTATAASGSASASDGEAGSSSENSDGTSSGASSSGNPFASEESKTSDSAKPSSSASSPASGSGEGETSAAEGGTEQVGVTKLSSSTATSASGSVSGAAAITPAPSPAGDLSARGLNQWWNMKREDEGETITSGDQCCFTTWTPSVVGGAGGAKATGTSSAGSKGTGSNSTGTGTVSGKSTGTKTGTAAASVTSASGTGKNGTTGVNGTNANGTNSSESYVLPLHPNLVNGGLDMLLGLGMAAGLGLLVGGITLV